MNEYAQREGNKDAILEALMDLYSRLPTGNDWVLIGQTMRLIISLSNSEQKP